MRTIEELARRCTRLTKDRVMAQTCHSRSQLYRWLRGEELERRERERREMPEETVENTAKVIATLPHMGGRKGQAYLLYHRLGLIGMRTYDRIKVHVRRLIAQEVSRRKLLPAPIAYEHVRPRRPGQIWAEDFTELAVDGHTFKAALLLDAFDQYYLGWAVDSRATSALVGQPVDQALQKSGGAGPAQFLLSDNGSQYISSEHSRLLTSAEIIQRRIPTCVPQYNGTAEAGMRDFKAVFYTVWQRRKREGADEEKELIVRVRAAVAETIRQINHVIPRPALGGVTPADVHEGRKEAKQQEIKHYRETEESRRDIPPWKRGYWDILQSGLRLHTLSDQELLTKLAFFGRKPLRRIAKLNRECVG